MKSYRNRLLGKFGKGFLGFFVVLIIACIVSNTLGGISLLENNKAEIQKVAQREIAGSGQQGNSEQGKAWEN